jgi:hypothetical protein
MSSKNEQREALLRRLAELDEERKFIMAELQRGAFMHLQHDIEGELQQAGASQKAVAQEKIADFQKRLSVIRSLFETLRQELPEEFSVMNEIKLNGYFLHRNDPFVWVECLRANLDNFQSSDRILRVDISNLHGALALKEEKDQLTAICDALNSKDFEAIQYIHEIVNRLERIADNTRRMPDSLKELLRKQYLKSI